MLAIVLRNGCFHPLSTGEQTGTTFIKVQGAQFIKCLKMYWFLTLKFHFQEFIQKKVLNEWKADCAIMLIAITYMIEKVRISYIYKIELIRYMKLKWCCWIYILTWIIWKNNTLPNFKMYRTGITVWSFFCNIKCLDR